MTATASTKASMTMTASVTATLTATLTLTWATVAALVMMVLALMTAKRWAEAKIETGMVMTLPMWAMTKGAMIADAPMVD